MVRSLNAIHTLRNQRPCTPNELHGWIRAVPGLVIPRMPRVPGHAAPFDYLCHAFFEPPPALLPRPGEGRGSAEHVPRDCVVWASRGAGKTMLGALATLLDLVFKPGIQVRIIAGSFDQASRLFDYLRTLIEASFEDCIDGRLTRDHVTLLNGSCARVLPQSACAIRGQRIHKLRCDEVDMLDDEQWDAAQLVTRSGWCGDTFVHAAVEALSTMHRPYGLMQRLVRESTTTSPAGTGTPAGPAARVLFHWNLIDILERCPPELRACEQCPLSDDCAGKARHGDGFLRIEDAIQQKARVALPTWRTEMLCEQPARSDCVYPEFEPGTHVADPPGTALAPVRGWVGGIDFGYRNPTVFLWALLDEADVLHVIDELSINLHTTEAIIAEAVMRTRALGLSLQPLPVHALARQVNGHARAQHGVGPINGTSSVHDVPCLGVGVDPAGHQRSEHTGVSTISLWKKAGFAIKSRVLPIEAGIGAVRRRLRSADGAVRLRMSPRCEQLIRSLRTYHYRLDDPLDSVPVKDGVDHAADALRYMVVNLDARGGEVKMRKY